MRTFLRRRRSARRSIDCQMHNKPTSSYRSYAVSVGVLSVIMTSLSSVGSKSHSDDSYITTHHSGSHPHPPSRAAVYVLDPSIIAFKSSRHVIASRLPRSNRFTEHINSERKPQLTRTTFLAAVDPGTLIPFLFTRCRYLSIFGILLLTY